MTRYVVKVQGCDDATYIAIDLTADEAAAISKVAAASALRSRCGCNPVISITTEDLASAWDRESAAEPLDES